MSHLSCGIVGLPNVGKSTLFNALLKKKQAGASNYPFCTIDPNVGIVEVRDNRLQALSTLSKSEKIVPATLTIVDIAGLVRGASKGEGLGNQFLAHIRETDALIHVVRCFGGENVIHVEGKVNPVEDISTINFELLLADLQMCTNSIKKLEKQVRGDKEKGAALHLLKKIEEHLNSSRPVRSLDLSKAEEEILKSYHFITAKKVIYAANIDEAALASLDHPHPEYHAVLDYAKGEGSAVIPFCASLEEALSELSEEESSAYLNSLGVHEGGLHRLVQAGFNLLDLITFLTTGKEETRAWTIKKGTLAHEAAGKIHTDIQKGFIKAEVIPFKEMVACGGRTKAKESGKARLEGRDYTVQDGDVILFFHN